MPQPQSHLHIHGYAETEATLEIPFEGYGEIATAKKVVSNLTDLQYTWTKNFDSLILKFPHPVAGERKA